MTDTANFTHEDLVRKIAGLLATAESFAEQGNDEAAQAYVQKAHTLQQKYAIDQAMLAAATGKKTEQIISKKIRMTGKWGKQKVGLAHVIAHATSCTGYYTTSNYELVDGVYGERLDTKQYYYTVFGFETDVDHVEFLVNSLSMQMDAAVQAAQVLKPSWEHGRAYNASFMEGYSSSIGYRLREAKKAAKQEYMAANPESIGMELVLVDKKKQVEAEMTARVGKLRHTSSSRSTGSGYSAGRAAGQRATIARGGVNGASRGSLGR